MSDNKYMKLCKIDKVRMVLEKLARDKLDDTNIILPDKKQKSKGAMNLFREDSSIGEATEREDIMAPFLQRTLWRKKMERRRKTSLASSRMWECVTQIVGVQTLSLGRS